MVDLPLASTKDSNGHVAVDIPEPVLHKVPEQVREGKDQIYVPVLVSLGPYHHGQPRLQQQQQVEDLKPEILHRQLHPVGRDDNNKRLLEEEIESLSHEIRRSLSHEIRRFYCELPSESKDSFNDDDLAKMMLLDASFLIYCITKMAADHDDCIVQRRLGMSRRAFVVRDLFMLENQLPFSVLKKVSSFFPRGDDDVVKAADADTFFYEILRSIMKNSGDSCSSGSNPPQIIPPPKDTLHLLDAWRRTLVAKVESTTTEAATVTAASAAASSHFRSVTDLKAKGIHFRSVTDLKAKGIHFRPTKSNSYSLKHITFKSHSFYGMLRLPIVLLDNKTSVIFSNIIAMEMAPGSRTDFEVTSYVKFMKSLIVRAEDVKELREKGIVVSCLAGDEEVVKMFSGLNTEGSCRKDIFREIRERIDKHCRSKTKTFKAELIHTYFRSPWTTIALLAAILILCVNCLNFLLNYYKFTLSVQRG